MIKSKGKVRVNGKNINSKSCYLKKASFNACRQMLNTSESCFDKSVKIQNAQVYF